MTHRQHPGEKKIKRRQNAEPQPLATGWEWDLTVTGQKYLEDGGTTLTPAGKMVVCLYTFIRQLLKLPLMIDDLRVNKLCLNETLKEEKYLT